MKGCYVKGNDQRFKYVTRAEADKVLDACPGTQWKLLFALARFGGLRCPSEPRLLKWSDIDLPRRRMRVHSPKTEHHEGKAYRDVKIDDALVPYLEDAKLVAEPHAEYVITLPALRRDSYANIGVQMARYVKRAGLIPWPKLFQNLRVSRAIDLAREQPLHVAAEWMGHDVKTAEKFYLRAIDLDFEKAHPNAHPLLQPIETEKSDKWQDLLQSCVEKAIESGNFEQLMATVGKSVKSQVVPPTGFEPVLPD